MYNLTKITILKDIKQIYLNHKLFHHKKIMNSKEIHKSDNPKTILIIAKKLFI
jgi:hypothetical protein